MAENYGRKEDAQESPHKREAEAWENWRIIEPMKLNITNEAGDFINLKSGVKCKIWNMDSRLVPAPDGGNKIAYRMVEPMYIMFSWESAQGKFSTPVSFHQDRSNFMKSIGQFIKQSI